MRPASLGLVLCTALASTASRRVIAAETPNASATSAVSKLESDVFRSRLTKQEVDRELSKLATIAQREDALELLGDLHNRWCLNEPALAGPYYERLGKVSNRAQALRGRYAQSLLLRDDQNASEALAAVTQALADFPDMTNIWRQALGNLKDDLERRSATKQ